MMSCEVLISQIKTRACGWAMEGKCKEECFGEGREKSLETEDGGKKKMGEEEVENGADPCGLEEPQEAKDFIHGQ